MTVVEFRLSSARVLEIFRETSRNHRRVSIPDPPEAGPWEKSVSYRQVIRCLEDGELVGGPTLDQESNWECVIRRFSAGVMVMVTAVLFRHENEWRIFVTNVEKA